MTRAVRDSRRCRSPERADLVLWRDHEAMRRNIVEGDDYSVLPVPVVRFTKWLREHLGGRKRSERPDAGERNAR